MKLSAKFLLSFATPLLLATVCRAEKVDSPTYKHWAKFKPGTTITIVNETTMAGTKFTSEMTTTLISVTADMAVIETKFTQNGQTATSRSEMNAKMERLDPNIAPDPNVETKESTEEIEVQGKKITAKLTITTDKSAGTVVKSWTSDEIPGMTVKTETTMTGQVKGTATTTIKSMTIK
jgi:hypothetical protein